MTENKGIIRLAAVAGRFYPADPSELGAEVQQFLSCDASPIEAVALMAPHAGFVYSGKTAGRTFAAVHVPERVIVLCPNHTGLGARVAVISEGSFALPGFHVPVDTELAAAVLTEAPEAQKNHEAHKGEHAIEVELPFLLARQPDLRIVPIVLSGLSERQAIDFGVALRRAAQRVSGDVMVVASSDMSHFLADEEARRVDHIALEPLLASDPSALYRTVRDNDISMCGFIPATVMLSYSHQCGGGTPRLVDYSTSGDAFGDRSRVVGYAGVVVPK